MLPLWFYKYDVTKRIMLQNGKTYIKNLAVLKRF